MTSLKSEERNQELGSKGSTLFSKCSLSRRNMICAAMVESIVLACLLITRPKRDQTRSEGEEVSGMDRKRRASKARRGNSGSSAFHWTSGCDCGAYHGRKGAAWLNQWASSHCTSRSSLASFFSSTCMSPSISITCPAEAEGRPSTCLLFLCGRSSCTSGRGDCLHRVRVVQLEEGLELAASYRAAILRFHGLQLCEDIAMERNKDWQPAMVRKELRHILGEQSCHSVPLIRCQFHSAMHTPSESKTRGMTEKENV